MSSAGSDANNDCQLTLKEALTLLEISELEKLDGKKLKTVGRRAKFRWHTDRIEHTNPADELRREYENNFVRIDDAIVVVALYLKHGFSGESFKTKSGPKPQENSEVIVRKNAPHNQSALRDAWPSVQANKFEFNEERIVLTEGISVSAALDEDLKDRVPSLALFALGTGFLYFLLAGFLVLFVAVLSEPIGTVLVVAWLAAWLAHAIACLLFMLPLSRIWLPEKVTDAVIAVVNATLDSSRDWQYGDDGLGKYAYFALALISAALHWLVVFPIYKIAGLFLQNKVIGRNKVAVRFYAGYAEHYIEQLLETPVQDLTTEQLFDLSGAVSAFKRMSR